MPDGNAHQIEFHTLPGVSYQLQESGDLEIWDPVGEPVAGDGAINSFDFGEGEVRGFVRVVATPE
jgi:hypothetical protein